jgi:hypothetical protein
MRSLALAFLLVGCGGAVVETTPGTDGGRREGGRDGSTTRDRATDSPESVDGSLADSFPFFREDACADAPYVPPPLECDPFNQSSCPLGLACYPYPPRATDACHPGTYGTICYRAGSGTQGTPCGDTSECAAGFICVKSAAGDQCVKLCRTNQFGSCPDGRICREVDVTGSGWGGCE